MVLILRNFTSRKSFLRIYSMVSLFIFSYSIWIEHVSGKINIWIESSSCIYSRPFSNRLIHSKTFHFISSSFLLTISNCVLRATSKITNFPQRYWWYSTLSDSFHISAKVASGTRMSSITSWQLLEYIRIC